MKIDGFKTIITRSVGRAGLVIQKYSPEILTSVGIVGVVTAGVMASKATLKLSEPLNEFKEHRALISQLRDGDPNMLEQLSKPYTDKDYQNDLVVTYGTFAKALTKLYGPAVVIGSSSIACILAAHGIMRRRNVALIAAYNLLQQGYDQYRRRVVEELGEEKDKEFQYGLKKETSVDPETKKEVTRTVTDPNSISIYARFFDEGSPNWSQTPEYNLLFLKSQQNYANDLLHSRGHLFLNDVYKALGIPETQAGQVVGWVLDHGGDNHVDFGIYDFDSDAHRAFVNGQEKNILLDFNVDGVILDLI